jgi:hypothetical protein
VRWTIYYLRWARPATPTPVSSIAIERLGAVMATTIDKSCRVVSWAAAAAAGGRSCRERQVNWLKAHSAMSTVDLKHAAILLEVASRMHCEASCPLLSQLLQNMLTSSYQGPFARSVLNSPRPKQSINTVAVQQRSIPSSGGKLSLDALD